MKRLATESLADKLRFAGKIYGSVNDYWIVSGEMTNAEPPKKNMDPRG
jgi:hypothetical protein